MFYFGDKFGDNKYDYNQGKISNVSIVLYDQLIPKMDRERMSFDVCFSFCRTVPDMAFFGIQNGRNCYCAPFFKAMEGDDSQCDAVCEGAPGQACGSKTKSTIFEMHECADTLEVLGDEVKALGDMTGSLQDAHEALQKASDDMQSAAEYLQKMFGSIGDPVASDLMQKTKVYAGELNKAAKKGKDADDALTAMKEAASKLQGKQKLTFEETEAAEELTVSMKGKIAEAEAMVKSLSGTLNDTLPNPDAKKDEEKEFYKVMYFVDKEYDGVPSTCGGDAYKNPMAGSLEACSQACDLNSGGEHCVAFNFMPSKIKGLGGGLCTMFSKLTSVQYYTGCQKSDLEFTNPTGLSGPAFIPFCPGDFQCWAKESSYDGTSIKPDPSGKCKNCLTTATKAARCIPMPR